jgi:valyl-tRNA synthetase
LSVEWSRTYATIDRRAQKVSQTAFLRLLKKGAAYQLEAPTLWDVDFRTAVAQAELEDREQPGAYHRIRFAKPDAGFVEIETTRPELIPACVALVAHPDDERYKPLFGTDVLTPLFNVPVPVKAHSLADPEKGSGIAMICTFGDLTDVTWWRELALPVRAVIMPNGAFRAVAWGSHGWESRDPPRAQTAYDQLANLSAAKARTRIVEMLRESGDLISEPRPITHPVKFFEKGDRPLEIVTSRQWFIKTMEYREGLLARGKELQWHPSTCGSATRTGSTGSPATGASAVSGSSACRFRCGIRCAQTAAWIMTAASCRTSRGCRSIRPPTCQTATRRSSATSRAGSRAIRTSWTRGRLRR